jgi:hypothetical protein
MNDLIRIGVLHPARNESLERRAPACRHRREIVCIDVPRERGLLDGKDRMPGIPRCPGVVFFGGFLENLPIDPVSLRQ